MWSTRQIDWQPDGIDLMQEAEAHYLKLKTKNMWTKRSTDGGKYVNQTTEIDGRVYDIESEDYPVEHHDDNTQGASTFGKDIIALTLPRNKFNKRMDK